jgi:very-short-patch-repair endonuclease
MNEIDIVNMYVLEDASTYVIAQKYNTYPNKIRRILIKNGVDLNNKSEAQKRAIKTGRTKHPTLGIKRDKEVKERISDAVHLNWKKMSKKERQERVDKAKIQWYNMTEQERESLKNAAAIAVRQASKDGSKMERFLQDSLPALGYDVIFHKTGLIPSENLEIDLFIPALNVAIEIDGPAHFFPIWGETSLQKHIKSDAHKSGLLLAYGFVVIRIKHLVRNLSEKHKRLVLNELLIYLKQIEKKFPPKSKRFIELEVK